MAHCPAPAGRPRFDIADIVRRHRTELEAEQPLTLPQRRVLSAIGLCRRVALGGHLDVCPCCGFERPAYNSCRNRHCPKCQALAQQQWIAARSQRMLPVRHFHLVFTLPRQLRSLAKYRPRQLFDALFSCATETLLELGCSRLEAGLGVTMVLHTWTRDLRWHPHLHLLVTAGGLSLDATHWVASSKNYLFPVQLMRSLLRGKMLSALHGLHARGHFDGFDDFRDPQGFDRLMASLARIDWVVYAKKPFRRFDQVLAYLGRYTHRVALSNSRLVNVTEDTVTFRTNNGQTITLPPVEFLARFTQHVLPDRFHKIRHAGLYAGSHAHGLLAIARAALPAPVRTAPASLTSDASWQDRLDALTGRDVRSCPRCGTPLHRVALPRNRAPPAQRLVA